MVKQKIDENDINMFVKEIARKICSANKQNAIIMITGQMGSGKSYTALEIARLISIYVAQKLGDKPEDHFTMEKHVGIMIMDEIAQIYEHMDTHTRNIYIIDD